MIHTKILPVVAAHPDIFCTPSSNSNSNNPALTPDDIATLAFRMGSTIMAYAFDLEPSSSPPPSPSPQPPSDPNNAADGWEEDHHPNPGPSPLGMVPMADALNADAAFNAHIQHAPDALTATTLRPIAAGEEVLNYYGPLGTGELVRRYGYATELHARWDLVDLNWALHVLPALRVELGAAVSGEEWGRAVFGMMSDGMCYYALLRNPTSSFFGCWVLSWLACHIDSDTQQMTRWKIASSSNTPPPTPTLKAASRPSPRPPTCPTIWLHR